MRANSFASIALAVLIACLPAAAHAWWNKDFTQRARVSLNTSAAGVEIREAQSGVTVPVRLHPGNFDFLAAAADGADLRVVAGDDKTLLRFSVERFDGINQLAVLWVQLPLVVPGTDKNELFVYAGNPKATAEALPAPQFDAVTLAAIGFADRDGAGADGGGTLKATAPFTAEPNALLGQGARLAGTAIGWPATDKVRARSGDPYTMTVWIKSETSTGTVFSQGPLRVGLDAGKVTAQLGPLQVAGGNVPVSAWAQVGVVLGGGKLVLYVDGQPAAEGALPAQAAAVEGPFQVGTGFTGVVDQLQIAGVARSADWMKFSRAVQGADAKLVASKPETEAEAAGGGGDAGYIGILVKNLTVDAWVVIGILGVMFVIAVWVMITKSVFVGRAAHANRGFVSDFRTASDVLSIDGATAYPNSSIARLYEAGRRELAKRQESIARAGLSGASLDAVKASIDADLVRENQRLNAQMVLLTIAISGGPFLGLLGTVVGVMITFAAIAAAGDVNVNAIAPGIAAALLATVAGLSVAIPALFGYNYLASRIKGISADMQVFVDEFVARVAEVYGAR